MKILVACEESQRVCIEFRKRGHEAYSCDIEPCSGEHQEWHIQDDVIPLLDGNCEFWTMDGENHRVDGMWDMIIAFPPCTYISNAGAKHLWKGKKLNNERYAEGLKAKEFFLTIYNANCNKIAIENPVSNTVFNMPPPTQDIQPYQFGHTTSKKTRLWLKGLPKLVPTQIVVPTESCHDSYSWYSTGGAERQANRAKTFIGVAQAMAEQWGKDVFLGRLF